MDVSSRLYKGGDLGSTFISQLAFLAASVIGTIATAVLLIAAQPPGDVTTAISYEVVPTPASPGYPPYPHKAGPPGIYPAIKANLEQVQQIHSPE